MTAASPPIEPSSAPLPVGLCKVVGRPTSARVEPARADIDIDHVWIDVDSGPAGKIRLAVPTFSRKNLVAGFSPVVRLRQIVLPNRGETPVPGIYPLESSSFEVFESGSPPPIEDTTRGEMEELLLREGRSASLVEAVGHLYRRDHLGLHEIHSLRASCAVERDTVGKEGWIRFHHPPRTLLLLIRFCGQV